ncbi:MAG: glycosyltransferase family 39 protein [Thermodesulfovibrionales bacterium]|nr:glycosyltransferase family 39 protein [Thermodesulfovibrionales bacterium]
MSTLKKTDHILIISFLAIFAFPVLFAFRHLDDNRLTSWQWVFTGVSAEEVFFLLLLGIALSYVIARYPLFHPSPRRLPFALFIISFAASAFFWREPEVIVDASRYFTQAKHLEIYGMGYFIREWGGEIAAWTDMPFVPFLYGLIFKFLGETRLFIQVFTSMLFSLTTVLTYLIGRELWDEGVGSAGGFLMLGMPYLMSQVPLMLVDVPSMFFLTFSVYTFQRALSRGGAGTICLSAASISLSVFSKYSLWLMLSGMVVLFIVRAREDRAGAFRRGGAALCLTAVLSGAILFYRFDVISEQIRFLMSYQRHGLGRWSESFTSTFLFQVHPFITAFALFSVYAAMRKRDLRYAIIIWLPLLILLLEIKRIRYLIPVFPMFALMASYGLREIKTDEVKRFIVSVAVLSSLTLAVFAYLPFLRQISLINLKDAGRFLDSLDVDAVEVFTLPQKSNVNPAVSVPLLDLFTKKRIIYDYGPDNRPLPEGIAPEDIERSPLRFTWEYKNPAYYAFGDKAGTNAAMVLISGSREAVVPAHIRQRLRGYRKCREFEVFSDDFRYKTIVAVFAAGPPSP